MCDLIDAYLADPTPPRIRVVDDMIKLLLGGAARKEGVGLSDYGIMVIDTDGTISKNDTLKSTTNAGDVFSENRSEEHTSELQSLMRISYAVFCLKKQSNHKQSTHNNNTT